MGGGGGERGERKGGGWVSRVSGRDRLCAESGYSLRSRIEECYPAVGIYGNDAALHCCHDVCNVLVYKSHLSIELSVLDGNGGLAYQCREEVKVLREVWVA